MSDPTKFYDIYEYIYIPFWKTTTFLIILLTLAGIALVIGLYFLIKYLRKRAQKDPVITPQQWALGELEKLTPNIYETKKEFKTFYFELTRITKLYLKKEFKWDVVEKTDDELVRYLRSNGADGKAVEIIDKMLQGSLLIKFANADALREPALKDLQAIISIVSSHTE